MNCNKCGREIAQGAKFCVSCGTPVASVNSDNSSNHNNYQYSNVYQGQNQYQNFSAAYPPPKKSGGKALILAVSLSVAALIIVVAAILIVMNLNVKKGIQLTVDACPSETENISQVLSGKVSSLGTSATLTVNGSEIITVHDGDEDVSWSKEVWLENGTNTFEIVLTSSDGDERVEYIEIEYKRELLYEEGTVLVKSDPEGIFIRPTPAITKEYILYVPYYDYTTQFVCQGEEYVDGEGYIWANVKIPGGKTGWVRTDIVEKLY